MAAAKHEARVVRDTVELDIHNPGDPEVAVSSTPCGKTIQSSKQDRRSQLGYALCRPGFESSSCVVRMI